VTERRLTLPDDDTLTSHAGHTVARHSRRGWRIDRPSRSAGQNIDAVIALAMALDRTEHQPQGLALVGWI
jgi:hypothetical protein